jgi:hypothetical protein
MAKERKEIKMKASSITYNHVAAASIEIWRRQAA